MRRKREGRHISFPAQAAKYFGLVLHRSFMNLNPISKKQTVVVNKKSGAEHVNKNN